MDPPRPASLGERIRWGNVARALALLAAVALVLAWPRLSPSEPALPPPPPQPLAVTPGEGEGEGEDFEGPEGELGGGRSEDREGAANGRGDRAARHGTRREGSEDKEPAGGSDGRGEAERRGGESERRGGSRGGRGGGFARVPAPCRHSSTPVPRPSPAPAPTPRRPAAPALTPRPAPTRPSPPPAPPPSDPAEREFGFE